MSNKQKTGNGGNNNKGVHGDVAANTVRSQAGRERKHNAAILLHEKREAGRADGSFYLMANADRTGGIEGVQMACSGVAGDYAYPGGDQPSVHYFVQNEVRVNGTTAVIRLESIQKGHPLHGTIFNQDIYLPCFYVEKFGTAFNSRAEERIMKATQEVICHYLAGLLYSRQEVSDVVQEEVESVVSENMADALDGVPGFYRYTSDAGTVVFKVFVTKYPVARIVQSNMESVTPSDIYLPLKLVKLDALTAGNQPEEVIKQQQAIFELLKDIATDLKAANIVNAPAVKPEKKTPGAKELAKQAKKAAAAKVQTAEEKHYAKVLKTIRQNTITSIAAVNGKLGFVEMSNLSGELIVNFGMIGNDRVVTVAHIGEKHMLRIAGVDTGTKVFAGQILNGLIDRIDAANLRMSQEDVKRGNALIGYIRDHFSSNGIHLRQRKVPDLKKVA
jgi:hypothetical protein